MKKEQHWFEDEKNWANKKYFNTILGGFFTIGLVFGSKHIVLFGNWKGYFIAIFSVIMLEYQRYILEEKIDYWKNKQ